MFTNISDPLFIHIEDEVSLLPKDTHGTCLPWWHKSRSILSRGTSTLVCCSLHSSLFYWTRRSCAPDGTALRGWRLCQLKSGNCFTGCPCSVSERGSWGWPISTENFKWKTNFCSVQPLKILGSCVYNCNITFSVCLSLFHLNIILFFKFASCFLYHFNYFYHEVFSMGSSWHLHVCWNKMLFENSMLLLTNLVVNFRWEFELKI